MLLPPLTGIRNIADLASAAEQRTVTYYTLRGHAITEILVKSEIESWRSIGECLKRNAHDHGELYDKFVSAPPKKAHIGGKFFLMRHKKGYIFSEDSFFNVMYGFPISRKFHCEKKLNKIIQRLVETGLFSKHYEDENFLYGLQHHSSDTEESRALKKLRFDDLKGVFLMLISGYVVASTIFLFEISKNFYFLKRNQ